ncbi:MAK10-like protein [Tanacetum coccineum]
MASQDTRLSKFEDDFKQQQYEMTNKIDTFLKVINDRMTGALPSDTVKNPKLNVNSTSLVLSARSYLMEDPQKPEKALEDEFKDFHLNLPVLEVLAHAPMYNAILDKYVESLELGKNGSTFIQNEIPKKMKDPGLFILPCRVGDSEPFDTLADLGSCMNLIPLYLFKMLKIGLLKETKNFIGLADRTKSYPVRIIEVYVGKLKLLEKFYLIDMEKDPTCPLLVGRGFLEIASTVIDCKKSKIAVGEAITMSIFRVREISLGAQPPYYLEKDFKDNYVPGEWEIAKDAELNPFRDVLVFRKMVEFLGAIPINFKGNMWESEDMIAKKIDWNKPPKEGDGAWHIRIEMIDPDGEKFDSLSINSHN